jgi:hypothetical protein
METQFFPTSKNLKTQKSSSKVSVFVFWNKDGILLADYLERVHPSLQSTTKYTN